MCIGAPCSRSDAEQWAAVSEKDVKSALRAANCYLSLATAGTDPSLRLADARTGRQLARMGVERDPGNGLAHYLYAYLTGLEAANDPLRGLQLVSVIEQEALLAAGLAPSIDNGGPYRMLGELYLRAPGIPISIGDVDKAIDAYRQAMTMAPGFHENQLGLAEALLQAGDAADACAQLHALLTGMPPPAGSEATWRRAMDLLKRLCAAKSE